MLIMKVSNFMHVSNLNRGVGRLVSVSILRHYSIPEISDIVSSTLVTYSLSLKYNDG